MVPLGNGNLDHAASCFGDCDSRCPGYGHVEIGARVAENVAGGRDQHVFILETDRPESDFWRLPRTVWCARAVDAAVGVDSNRLNCDGGPRVPEVREFEEDVCELLVLNVTEVELQLIFVFADLTRHIANFLLLDLNTQKKSSATQDGNY